MSKPAILDQAPDCYQPRAGREAFGALEAELRAMKPAQIGAITFDPQAAAVVALALVANARAPARRRRLALIDTKLLSPTVVQDLKVAAWATWYCHTQMLSEVAASKRPRVDKALIEQSRALIDKLTQLIHYNLGEVEEVAAELDAIRAGRGYQDMATDLVRLAALWERHHDELAGDRRRYHPEDGDKARKLAQAIVRQLKRRVSPKKMSFSELRLRAFSRMAFLYEELRFAGAFVFRHEPAHRDVFIPLRTGVLTHFGGARRAHGAAAREPVDAD